MVKGTILKIMRTWHQVLATFLRPSGQIRSICYASLWCIWTHKWFIPDMNKKWAWESRELLWKKRGLETVTWSGIPLQYYFQCSPCLVIASLKLSKATRILQTQSSVSAFARVPRAASLNSCWVWIVRFKYYHVYVIIVTTCLPSLKKDEFKCISFASRIFLHGQT